jgi:DNA-binding LacI/PurR family transcriptional regulator
MTPPRTRVTLASVAARVGVTPMTVSNAYNRPERLSAALRERILDAATELGYAGPDPIARSLRRGRTGAVGLLLGEELTYALDDPSAVEFLAGLAAGCTSAGANLLLIASGNPGPLDGTASSPAPRTAARRAVAAAIRVVDEASVDAFVVWDTPDDHPLINAVLARRLPVVIHGGPRLPGVPYVSIDNRAAAASVAAHVLAGGRREIAIVSRPFAGDRADRHLLGPDRRTATRQVTRSRLDGFADALAAAGGDWARTPVFEVAANDRAHGRVAGAALLHRDPPPAAILAMGDELALGVLQAAKERRLRVPDQLAVTGWDDSPRALAAEPRLTTVAQSVREQGLACARAVLDRPTGPAEADLHPWRLVVRASTG